MPQAIKTYRSYGHWCVRVYGSMLVGHFKTEQAAQSHGEWYLRHCPHPIPRVARTKSTKGA